jgi:5'(3')-deoxyribonucleotidase
MLIALDVDEVCLDLSPTWLGFYNRDFDDHLKKEDLNDWAIHLFVKPEAKEAIYEYINKPEVFLESKPVAGALACVNYLKSKGHRVIYVTANNPMDSKKTWLRTHGFLISDNDFVQASDKSLILADILFDDNYKNCIHFQGTAYLLSAPWNKMYDYPFRVYGWDDFMSEVL